MFTSHFSYTIQIMIYFVFLTCLSFFSFFNDNINYKRKSLYRRVFSFLSGVNIFRKLTAKKIKIYIKFIKKGAALKQLFYNYLNVRKLLCFTRKSSLYESWFVNLCKMLWFYESAIETIFLFNAAKTFGFGLVIKTCCLLNCSYSNRAYLFRYKSVNSGKVKSARWCELNSPSFQSVY